MLPGNRMQREESLPTPVDSHRLSILTRQEIDELYGLPRFTDEDRQVYFGLSEPEQRVVHARTVSVAVHLTLQLGYFKAKRQFFDYDQTAVEEDLHHILGCHFAGKSLTGLSLPSYPTRRALRHTVLELFGFRPCDNAAKADLERRAQRIAMLSTQPIYILRETLQHLGHQRIVAPAYAVLQDMVGRVVTGERRRITGLPGDALTRDLTDQLDALLQTEESTYRITVLKREPRDFTYRELRDEVERRQFFAPLHGFAKRFLDTTGISTESSRYYASLVKFHIGIAQHSLDSESSYGL